MVLWCFSLSFVNHTQNHPQFQVRMIPSSTWSPPEPWWAFRLLICLNVWIFSFTHSKNQTNTIMESKKETLWFSCPGQWPEQLVVPCITFVLETGIDIAMQRQVMLTSSLSKQGVYCPILVSWSIIILVMNINLSGRMTKTSNKVFESNVDVKKDKWVCPNSTLICYFNMEK